MDKWPWHSTTTDQDNSRELQREKISPVVSDKFFMPMDMPIGGERANDLDIAQLQIKAIL